MLFRSVSGYNRHLGIGENRAVYIPYIVKHREKVLAKITTDEGFILSCGKSTRDYATLIEAVRPLPYPVKILCPMDEECGYHGTQLSVLHAGLPDNIQLVHDDGTFDAWLDCMSRCTLVALPITPSAMFCQGIGTYLLAMALRKCVIISRNEGANQLIDHGECVLVPGGDVAALRKSICEAWEDRTGREGVADKGYHYAMTLGDEARLQRDILVTVERLIQTT